MFSIPDGAELLFSSDLVTNQGFVLDNMVGLQFHFEPLADNVREIVVNDGEYALDHNDLHQTPAEIIDHGVPAENQQVMFTILDYLSHQ
ncbi:glutamine amidotransferase class-I [Limosilactobacillus coleohominis DSM 14060]|nr:glutamine amidotransferase class-I [Limosilactobacillus coleohominis DSM 14060]